MSNGPVSATGFVLLIRHHISRKLASKVFPVVVPGFFKVINSASGRQMLRHLFGFMAFQDAAKRSSAPQLFAT